METPPQIESEQIIFIQDGYVFPTQSMAHSRARAHNQAHRRAGVRWKIEVTMLYETQDEAGVGVLFVVFPAMDPPNKKPSSAPVEKP